MKQYVAVFSCWVLAFFVIRLKKDVFYKPTLSLMVPLLWLVFIVSRSPGQWLNSGGWDSLTTAENVMEGSPLNRTFYTLLEVLGVIILMTRSVNWYQIILKNKWIVVLFVYYLVSISWSDFPAISFKRIIKDLGNPIMMLVLITDKNSVAAIKYILSWCTYLLIPLSIIYFKYFPELGRLYGRFSGEVSITGVALTKNGLGVLCMICGVYLVWEITSVLKNKENKLKNLRLIISICYLIMDVGVLLYADSATSLMTLIVASTVYLIIDVDVVKKNLNKIGTYFVTAIVIFLILQATIGIFEKVVVSLGRDPTLTGRTDLWEECLKMKTNPIIGVGYQSFWVGARYEYFLQKYTWKPNEAHNGYLETYLEQGFIGLALLVFFLFGTFKKIQIEFLNDFSYGKVRLSFYVVALMYNVTEASLKSLQPMWFILLMISMVDSKLGEGRNNEIETPNHSMN